ncbi:MAG: leucine-rich repeat domain-containing protein, partial [Ruminiclostridium sp.]|nr:leucine-rich repeat domain-containing protein [Ruminiclostridium sp.]
MKKSRALSFGSLFLAAALLCGCEKTPAPAENVTEATRERSFTAVDTVEFVEIGGETFSADLTRLDLSVSNLTDADLAPLSLMTALETLDLSANRITDLS